jgi:hypothetical protein
VLAPDVGTGVSPGVRPVLALTSVLWCWPSVGGVGAGVGTGVGAGVGLLVGSCGVLSAGAGGAAVGGTRWVTARVG